MKTLYLTFVFLMLFFTTGCMHNDAVVIADKSGVETDDEGMSLQEAVISDDKNSKGYAQKGRDTAEEDTDRAGDVQAEGSYKSSDSDKTDGGEIYVYVCGHVFSPGVYKLSTGSRIYDAIDLAGGITDDGRPEALDQAKPVSDGQTIYVPGLDEEWTGVNSLEREESAFSPNDEGTVNINSASKEVLMTLPGIGESKADDIIRYREETGGFKSIEDIMKIQGIKEGVYNKIKDRISI